jgi:hypothetical protein
VNGGTFTYSGYGRPLRAAVQVKDDVTTVRRSSAVHGHRRAARDASVTADKTTLRGHGRTWTVAASGGSGAKQYYYQLYLGNTVSTPPRGSATILSPVTCRRRPICAVRDRAGQHGNRTKISAVTVAEDTGFTWIALNDTEASITATPIRALPS